MTARDRFKNTDKRTDVQTYRQTQKVGEGYYFMERTRNNDENSDETESAPNMGIGDDYHYFLLSCEARERNGLVCADSG